MCDTRIIAVPPEVNGLLATAGGAPRRLLLQLNLGRGRYEIGRSDPGLLAEDDGGRALPGAPNFLDITPAREIQAFASGPRFPALTELGGIQVRQMGEPIEFVRFIVEIGGIVWFVEHVLSRSGDLCDFTDAEYRIRAASPGEPAVFNLDAYRRAYADGPPPDPCEDPKITAARRFFLTLDLHTHPQVRGGEPTLMEACLKLMGPLRTRLLERIGSRRADPRPMEARWVDVIAAYFTSLTAEVLNANPEELAEAFELFAGGELRWRLSHGEWMTQPSSGQVFLFGEFALAAYERTREDAWLVIARGMIRAQEIFLACYTRCEHCTGMGAYSGCAYEGPVDGRFKASLRRRYAAFGYDELLAQSELNAFAALR